MKTLFACLIVATIFTGCAGTALDTDFRRKVSESDTTLNGAFDPVSKTTSGQVSNKLIFRDPDTSK